MPDLEGYRAEILGKLESIEDLPSLPVVIMRLTDAIEDSNSSAVDVARIMEDDPAIMARVLKMVNSAFYSGSLASEPITNAQQAIVRLGYEAVRNVALTSSVFDIFCEEHAQAFNRMEFWRHCISVGIVANVIYDYSTVRSKIQRDSLALGGLLHDMGKIIQEQYFYSLFTQVLTFAEEHERPLYQIEESVFRIDHSEIGAWLGRTWRLNPELIACIEFHHHPMRAPAEYREMVCLVHIADYICNLKKIGHSGNPKPPPFNDEIWRSVGLHESKIPEILAIAEKESEKSEILLSLA